MVAFVVRSLHQIIPTSIHSTWPSRSHPLPRILNLPIANMLAGRGCFANCNFCSISAWHKKNGGPRFRFRSPDQVAAEMAYLYHEHGVRIFNFHDDNFFNPRHQDSISRFEEIKKHLKREKINRIGIQVKARPDSISQPVVSALKDIGLFRVFLGVENNAVAGLHALGRGTTRARNYAALDILEKNDIHTTFNLLMFEPDMTADDYKDNVDIMHTRSTLPLNFGRVEVYGGTPLEEALRAQQRLRGTYFGYTYRIKDSAMQTAFEIFNRVFTDRNFDPHGMNLMAMQLDYNFHLLKHFYPHKASLKLRNDVKRCIEELNHNSASLMMAIHDYVTDDKSHSTEDISRFTARLLQARKAYDDNNRPVFTALLHEIERAAIVSPDSPSFNP
ncbi:MAG: B12-binding domain-containing radical SAM protein [Chitinispirillaceae bacterium]